MSEPKNNVIPFSGDLPTFNSGGNGGDGGSDMFEVRVKKLEDDLNLIKTDLAVMKANYATKEDIASVRIEVHQSIATQTKWIAATMLGITGLAIGIAKLIF
ncbi:hemolysin XhlA [Photorhabdus bodei]|uniref:hemolysin XhlA n=1 Tax=Photorhabdus bodei TaxID=2029681 RepID=UPI001E3A63A7|nr:hemolysin XhlA [Photorhabdus bodei]